MKLLDCPLEVPRVLGVLDRNAAQVVPAGGHRSAEPLGDGRHRGLRPALPDTVACVDQRPLGLVQRQRYSLDVIVGWITRPDRRDSTFDNVRRKRGRTEHTVIYRQMNGPHRRRSRDAYSTLNCRWQAFRLHNSPVLLCHRSRDRRGPKAVTQIKADPVGEAASVSGKRDNDNR